MQREWYDTETHWFMKRKDLRRMMMADALERRVVTKREPFQCAIGRKWAHNLFKLRRMRRLQERMDAAALEVAKEAPKGETYRHHPVTIRYRITINDDLTSEIGSAADGQ